MTATVGRASLAVKQRDILKEEIHALKTERDRDAEQIVSLSRYLWRSLPVNTPQRAVAARLVSLSQRRVPKDAA